MHRRVQLLLVLLALLAVAAVLVLRSDNPCVGPFDHLDDRLLGRTYTVRCAG
jgi:hypothetical protein